MSTMFQFPSVGPYVGVSHDERVTFQTPAGERTFRVLIYGAYNAFGLIGSECNGIAVLDEDNRSVVTDEIAKEPSGYFGASADQKAEFARILALPWAKFRDLVNAQPRTRSPL